MPKRKYNKEHYVTVCVVKQNRLKTQSKKTEGPTQDIQNRVSSPMPRGGEP